MIQYFMITSYIIDYSLGAKVGLRKMREYNIFPLIQKELFVLVATINDDISVKELQKLFNIPIKYIKIPQKEIEQELYYFEIKNEIFNLATKSLKNSIKNEFHNSYIIEMMDKLVIFAVTSHASDIHIESLKKSVAIRFRIDGSLNLIFTFEYDMYGLLSSIIKLFASLDISQTRLPQNGRFTKDFNNHMYDFRVSTIPILNGESIVIRILDSNNSHVTLDNIGFDQNIFNTLNETIHLHQGMILVTGPTGSGKTTTLYSILNTLNRISKKIITIEDPIEYNLAGIQQVSINEDIGLDYPLALKNILRQDPDIIMIGEIRDEKALKIAIQAALTGHLVLATLHTNNAVDTINRLIDLNAEPFLIASTLQAIVSQRLVKKLCKECTNGCSKCNLSGYDGRVVVAELLKCDNNISKYIAEQKEISTIIKYAKTNNYITLQEAGMTKVKNNIISIDEFYAQIKT